MSEFLKQHGPKVLKIVKFDESVNAFVLLDHLDLTEINLSALAEINYGWDLWQHQQSKVDELQKRINDSQDIIESILARSLDNPEIQDLCGQLIDMLEKGIKGGEDA